MTEEQEKVLIKDFYDFVKETRENFAGLFEDRETDNKLLKEMYIALGQTKAEAHTLVGEVEQAKKEVKAVPNKIQKTVDSGVDKIEKNLEGKTRIMKILPFWDYLKRKFRFKGKND